MKNTIFTGAATAIVTPMQEDGSVNYQAFSDLLEMQIENHIDAIVVCGTTGESSTLSQKEYTQVVQFAAQQIRHRVPVIIGAGSNNTAHSLELCAIAEDAGADALLLVTPYYNKTSQDGLVAHYTHIADRVHTPIIIYNVPSRTGCGVKPSTYYKLSKHPNIAAIKEANGDISAIAETAALCGENLDIYSGNDDQVLPILSLGGKGVISVFSNLLPYEMHKICEDYFAGDLPQARKTFLEYLELMKALFSDVNPIPVKEAMNQMGLSVGPCRLPLVPMKEEGKSQITAVLKKYGLI